MCKLAEPPVSDQKDASNAQRHESNVPNGKRQDGMVAEARRTLPSASMKKPSWISEYSYESEKTSSPGRYHEGGGLVYRFGFMREWRRGKGIS